MCRQLLMYHTFNRQILFVFFLQIVVYNLITHLIGQFIAVGGASFRMIEGVPFKQLMHAPAPQYVVPALATFSTKPFVHCSIEEKNGQSRGSDNSFDH